MFYEEINLDNLFSKNTDAEIFYKSYYEAGKDPEALRAFLDALIPDSYEINNYYIPELNSYKYDNYGENHLFSSSRNNIAVERHNRYTPPFRHSHTFFEMIYVYKGSCENTIENETIVMEQGNICIVAPGVSHSISIFDESTVVNIL